MRIGELAEAAGTTTKTLRFYEEQGLLPPAERTPAGSIGKERQVGVQRLNGMVQGVADDEQTPTRTVDLDGEMPGRVSGRVDRRDPRVPARV